MGRNYDQKRLVKHSLARVSLIVQTVLNALTDTKSLEDPGYDRMAFWFSGRQCWNWK